MSWFVGTVVAVAAFSAGTPASALGLVGDKPIVESGTPGDLPGSGPVPGGFSSWAELMSVQAQLDAAADRVEALGGAGLAGVEVHAENRRVIVHYKGAVPAGLRQISAAMPARTAMTVRSAAHSRRELQAVALGVTSLAEVASVAPSVDGSGLEVSLRRGRVSTDSQTKVRGKAGGVVVRYLPESDTALTSRGNDSPPYWGGARWNGCSNGFAIRISGSTKMLSAGHCAANGNTARDGGGDVMGTVSGDSNAYDRLYINTSSGGRIYDGGVGSGEFSKPVVGAARSYVGNWLCDSGAYSGARCGIQVKATNVTINVGYLIYGTVRAEKTDHTAAIGNGDSGGPVFSLSPDPNKVIAKGTNTAIDTSVAVPCTGVPTSSTRTCSWRFYYVDVVNSLNAYGASIVTG
jgi:hypothetical protein